VWGAVDSSRDTAGVPVPLNAQGRVGEERSDKKGRGCQQPFRGGSLREEGSRRAVKTLWVVFFHWGGGLCQSADFNRLSRSHHHQQHSTSLSDYYSFSLHLPSPAH